MAGTNALVGTKYTWSGTDFQWTAANKAKYIIKGTGNTLTMAALEQTVGSETARPFNADATKWIMSDDLQLLGARTASVRIKALKTAETSYTSGTHILNACPFLDPLEPGASLALPAAWSAAYPVFVTTGQVASNGGVQNYLAQQTAIAEDAYSYTHFHFTSDANGSNGVLPYRYIGFYLRMVAHATTDPADPVVHTWQFEAEWYYTMDPRGYL